MENKKNDLFLKNIEDIQKCRTINSDQVDTYDLCMKKSSWLNQNIPDDIEYKEELQDALQISSLVFKMKKEIILDSKDPKVSADVLIHKKGNLNFLYIKEEKEWRDVQGAIDFKNDLSAPSVSGVFFKFLIIFILIFIFYFVKFLLSPNFRKTKIQNVLEQMDYPDLADLVRRDIKEFNYRNTKKISWIGIKSKAYDGDFDKLNEDEKGLVNEIYSFEKDFVEIYDLNMSKNKNEELINRKIAELNDKFKKNVD